jgi:hypothetical protein
MLRKRRARLDEELHKSAPRIAGANTLTKFLFAPAQDLTSGWFARSVRVGVEVG